MRCERCGKRTYNYNFINTLYPLVSLSIARGLGHMNTHVELCGDCERELINWLDSFEGRNEDGKMSRT